MLFLFSGKYRDIARTVAGIALIVVSIVAHMAIAAAAGGVFIVWGGLRLLRTARGRRGQ
jgi:hypothetical protein